jgi:hypothetical protein
MTTRFSRKAHSASSKKSNCSSVKSNGKNRAFAGALIKKLNEIATRNRIIQRSLHSVSARMEERFKCKHLRDESTAIECNSNNFALDLDFPTFPLHNTSDLELPNFPQEDPVPQQEWDELFESAFEAIGDRSIEAFDQ